MQFFFEKNLYSPNERARRVGHANRSPSFPKSTYDLKKIPKFSSRTLLSPRITVTLELIALTLFSCTMTSIFEKFSPTHFISLINFKFGKVFAHFFGKAYEIYANSSSNDSVERGALHGRNKLRLILYLRDLTPA